MKQAPKPIANYNCTQAELYAVCRIGWNNCSNNIAHFSTFKTFYTPQYITDRFTEINHAASLPDNQQRGETAEIAHNQLKETADQCLITWQALKAYISDAFNHNHLKPKLEAAGSTLYHKASKYDWETISQLINQTSQFITDNTSPLSTNGGMPPIFPTQVNNLKTQFASTYQTFQTEQQAAEVLTTQKINANNLIHQKLMKMFNDGKQIFRFQPALREQFIGKQILHLVSSTRGEKSIPLE